MFKINNKTDEIYMNAEGSHMYNSIVTESAGALLYYYCFFLHLNCEQLKKKLTA